MVDIKACVLFVMKQEDSTLSGRVTNIPNDLGGTTRLGLVKKYHSQLDAQGFFSEILVPTDRAIIMAEAAYEEQYALPLHLAEFKAQAIATAMLSFSVVEGNRKAIDLLQKGCIYCGQQITADGLLGDQTIDAANALSPENLLQAWIAQEDAYFQSLVDHNPSQQKFLKGWEARAEALVQLL